MYSSYTSLALVASSLVQLAHGQAKICKEAACSDCPVSTTTAGTGYPDCTIYNSADVFTGLFEKNDAGEYEIWVDFPTFEDTQCRWIFKSPASVDIQTCGKPILSTAGGKCRTVSLKETFMLQFCCGYGDCCAAGLPNQPGCDAASSKRSLRTSPNRREMLSGPIMTLRSTTSDSFVDVRNAGGVIQFVGPDGQPIKPAQEGSVPVKREYTKEKRGDSCDKNSWVDDGAEYVTTGDGSNVVSDLVSGGKEGAEIPISMTRTSSWSTTLEANIGFADILSLGVSFSVTEEESISSTRGASWTVPAGQTGYVAFTPSVICKNGVGRCGGKDVKGRVCTPFTSNGNPAGEFSLVQVDD